MATEDCRVGVGHAISKLIDRSYGGYWLEEGKEEEAASMQGR